MICGGDVGAAILLQPAPGKLPPATGFATTSVLFCYHGGDRVLPVVQRQGAATSTTDVGTGVIHRAGAATVGGKSFNLGGKSFNRQGHKVL